MNETDDPADALLRFDRPFASLHDRHIAGGVQQDVNCKDVQQMGENQVNSDLWVLMVCLLFVDCAASAVADDSAETAAAAFDLAAVPSSRSVVPVGGVDASMARLCISCVGRLPAASSLDISIGGLLSC